MMNLYNNQDIKPVLPSLNYNVPKQNLSLPVPMVYTTPANNAGYAVNPQANLPPLQFYSNNKEQGSSRGTPEQQDSHPISHTSGDTRTTAPALQMSYPNNYSNFHQSLQPTVPSGPVHVSSASTSVSLSPQFSTASPSNSGYVAGTSSPNYGATYHEYQRNDKTHPQPYLQGYEGMQSSQNNERVSIDYSSIINYTISPSLKRKRRNNSGNSGTLNPSHQEEMSHMDELAPKLPCNVCGKIFAKPYNLKSHMKSHSTEKPYKCGVCGKDFARSHDKKRHELLHKGEKNFKCEGFLNDGKTKWGCGKRFARSDALSRHFRTETGWLCIKPLMDEAKHMESNDLINTLINH